jgi:hypothetical protein
MNPDTGAIAKFTNMKDAVLAGYTENLTEEEATQLENIVPTKRVAALAEFRGSKILTRAYIPPRRKKDQ